MDFVKMLNEKSSPNTQRKNNFVNFWEKSYLRI